MAVHITNKQGGNFDWDIAMNFLKMSYYRCSVEEVEGFISDVEKLTNADKKQGKREVWEHAKECGISDDIALIAKYFDIKDVSIISNGKISFMEDMPRKCIEFQQLHHLSFTAKRERELSEKENPQKRQVFPA